MSAIDWCLVGLGNPGREYENTRHNAGFMILDALAEKLRTRIDKTERQALTARVTYQGHSLLLVKPQTYMNDSGRSVQSLLHFYKIPVERCLVVYDDLDFDLGTIKLRQSGSPGTHNGMESVINCVGSQAVPRLRVGIGPRVLGGEGKFGVLDKFSSEQAELLTQTSARGADALLQVVRFGVEKAMNGVNGSAAAPTQAKPQPAKSSLPHSPPQT